MQLDAKVVTWGGIGAREERIVDIETELSPLQAARLGKRIFEWSRRRGEG